MELKIKDVVDLLQISEKTIYRWIKEKKIPCYRIQHQYRFNRAEINEWIMSNKVELSSKLIDLTVAKRPTNFTDLLRHGGIHHRIQGKTVRDVLHNSIAAIPTPSKIDKDEIIAALLNREELMSTAVGHGIAIPHPRNPLITNIEDASVSICFLEESVDYKALDGKPVHTLFVLLTYSPKRHLEILSKISYLCQLDDFRKMLERRAPADEILEYIHKKEIAVWEQKESSRQ